MITMSSERKDTRAMGDLSEVQRMYGADPVFREVADLLYGGGSDLIYKSNPDQTSLHVNGAKDRRQRRVTAGLSAVGASAGVAGLAYGSRDMYRAVKAGKKIPKTTKALVPLEVAGLGGELMATHILHNDTKKPKNLASTRVRKDIRDIPENASYPTKGKMLAATITSPQTKKGITVVGGKLKKLPDKVETTRVRKARNRIRDIKRNVNATAAHAANASYKVGNAADEAAKTFKTVRRGAKGVAVAGGAGAAAGGYKLGEKARNKYDSKFKKSADLDIRWEGEISKLNVDKQQVFGWASIVEVNGEPVVDLQGDYISIDEVEKAGYDYVVKSRKGGDMHLRDGDQPVHKSDMIESFIVTPEKKKSMGLPDSVPTGWWVGYQVNDADTWQLVKDGKRTGFSIHGRGVRTEM